MNFIFLSEVLMKTVKRNPYLSDKITNLELINFINSCINISLILNEIHKR